MKKREWLSYPENKPENSEKGSKKFYYVQVSDKWYEGCGIKCWYNDMWLCDSYQTVIRDVIKFTDAPSNGKHEIDY